MCAYSAILRLKMINKSIEAIELSKIPRDIWATVALSEIIPHRFQMGWCWSPISGSYLGYWACRIYMYRWIVGLLWTLLSGPPDEQHHHAPLHFRSTSPAGSPDLGVPPMGWGPAEPGWASSCGERCTGDDAPSAPPREQDQGKDQDQDPQEDGDEDFTGRGQVVGPGGPCTRRPASGPSGLYTWRGFTGRRLEDGEEQQAASAVPGHQPDRVPAWQAT